MTTEKEEFLLLMQFPEAWETLGMYPEELYQGQRRLYKPGDENAAEHDRYGAFHWWLRRSPTKQQLRHLIALANADPDTLMGQAAKEDIRKAIGDDPELLDLLRR